MSQQFQGEMGELQARAATSRLDTVVACSDLAGDFPANVGATFIPWMHGLDIDEFAAADQSLALGEKLAARKTPVPIDHIGIEVAAYTGERVEDIFQRANSHLAQWQPNTMPDIFWVRTNVETIIIGIAAKFLEAGLQPPTFFPIDIFDRADLQEQAENQRAISRNVPVQNIYLDFGRRRVDEARLIGARESHDLRQIHAYAHGIAGDGKQHEIAIIQGMAHDLTAVAARILGWPARLAPASAPAVSPWTRLHHQIRLNEAQASNRELIAHYLAAERLAMLVFVYTGQPVRLRSTIDSEYRRSIIREYTLNYLGMACLHGYDGRLPDETQLVFNQLSELISDQEETPAEVIAQADAAQQEAQRERARFRLQLAQEFVNLLPGMEKLDTADRIRIP